MTTLKKKEEAQEELLHILFERMQKAEQRMDKLEEEHDTHTTPKS